MLANMPLDELRAARHLTQEHLASILGIKQSNISKMKRRTDIYVSTLTKFIEAMGGTPEIRACFPDGSVRINQFSERRKSTRRDVSFEKQHPKQKDKRKPYHGSPRDRSILPLPRGLPRVGKRTARPVRATQSRHRPTLSASLLLSSSCATRLLHPPSSPPVLLYGSKSKR